MDYHDLLLPLVNRVNELEGTVFFLTPGGCLMPVAIELTRPPVDGKPQRKQEFCAIPGIPLVPGYGSLLKPKAHVLAHDSGYHQLVSHWLRTHCATEPYIIASNRQLSAVHPIFRLLQPHFRYTMEINALACLALINANGIIESSFSPSKYSMLLCSIA
nr:linoleate 13S-lipoxygenase 2-1, chloroplastic [Ipomoea batatas]